MRFSCIVVFLSYGGCVIISYFIGHYNVYFYLLIVERERFKFYSIKKKKN